MNVAFGKYHLVERLAEGGMAVVFRAKLLGPSGFEKSLVVKQIRSELAARKEFIDLFVAEAKVTVSLTHANIVPIYEFGMVDDTYFLALELIDGPPLAELVKKGPIAPGLAAYVAEQVLRGLDYAHRREVVHRDLSSANVLCSRDGEVKIVDFGIASTVDAQGIKGGSRGYVAPEQEAGGRVDARSDLYAVGILLWEMCAGRRYDGTKVDAPQALTEIITRATARDPEARFDSAATMLQQISRYLREADATQADLCAYVRRVCPDVPHRDDADENENDPDESDEDRGGQAAGPRTVPVAGRAPVKEVTFATRIAPAPELGTSVLRRALIGLGALLLVGSSAFVGARMRDAAANVPLPILPSPGQLRLDVTPRDALVRIDGKATLARTIELGPGTHQLSASATGRQPIARQVVVEAGATRTEVLALSSQLGHLKIETDPSGASVSNGDNLLGTTPLEVEVAIDRPPTLRITKRDFQPTTRTLALAIFVGQPPSASITETLKPLPRGELTLGAKPWAHVTIDGEKRPDTPIVKLSLAAGTHAVKLVCPPTGHELKFTVQIEAGEEVRRVADLVGDPHLLE